MGCKKTDYLELEFRPSLLAFATQRSELMAVLDALSLESVSSGLCCPTQMHWLAMDGHT